MVLEFPYSTAGSTESDGPLIRIKICSQRERESLALIDSGAVISVIPKWVAQQIGCPLEGELVERAGFGGSVYSIRSVVTFDIQNANNRRLVLVPVDIVDDDNIPCIIGRQVFFDLFNISFKKSENVITLDPVHLKA